MLGQSEAEIDAVAAADPDDAMIGVRSRQQPIGKQLGIVRREPHASDVPSFGIEDVDLAKPCRHRAMGDRRDLLK